MYRILVIEGGMDPVTLLEKMRPHEVIEHLGGLKYRDREGWEQARMIAYLIAQVNSRKELSPREVMPLPWDEKVEVQEITDEDLERLAKKAEEIKKWLI